jgi:hypothetical protein
MVSVGSTESVKSIESELTRSQLIRTIRTTLGGGRRVRHWRSLRKKRIRNSPSLCPKVGGGRGRWRIGAHSVLQKMSYRSGRVLVDVGQMPKDERGRTGDAKMSCDRSSRYVNAGNGSRRATAAKASIERSMFLTRIFHTRSCCSSAAMMLYTRASSLNTSQVLRMTIGTAGHIPNIALTSLLSVQRSRRFRRRGDNKTADRQL